MTAAVDDEEVERKTAARTSEEVSKGEPAPAAFRELRSEIHYASAQHRNKRCEISTSFASFIFLASFVQFLSVNLRICS